MSSSFDTSFVQEIEDIGQWLSPPDLLAQLPLRPGMTVADIGAGRASYALPMGRHVAPDGAVFAVEWRPWMMDELHIRLAGPGAPDNVKFVAGSASDTRLPAASCDLVVLAGIWHELEHQDATLDEARRILRPDGRLAILNWRPDSLSPPGPPTEHRVSMQRTICTLEMKSWSVVKAADIGAHAYLLVFEMTDESLQS